MFLFCIFKPIYNNKDIIIFIIAFMLNNSSNYCIRFFIFIILNCNKIIKMQINLSLFSLIVYDANLYHITFLFTIALLNPISLYDKYNLTSNFEVSIIIL